MTTPKINVQSVFIHVIFEFVLKKEEFTAESMQYEALL